MEKDNQKQVQLFKEFVNEDSEEFFEQMVQFNELMMKYNSAIREVRTKLEILNDELSLQSKKNPIEFIKSRTKKPLSIAGKLKNRGKELTISTIVDELNDVAGIRVVCSFIDDIYKVADMLTKQDDITLIQVKDYIKNPKPNGYRSYHMIVEVPVFFSEHKQLMKVEVQIRTVAMDFWASLEHNMKYKNEIPESQEIINDLRECAETIAHTDERMMAIRNRIEK